MDVADDMVDVVLIHYYLGESALYELVAQFIYGTFLHVHSLNLGAWHHAIPHLGVAEVEGVVEDFHLIGYLLVILGIVDTALHEIVEIHSGESRSLLLFLHLHSHHEEHGTGKEGGKARYGIEHDIEHHGRDGKEGEHSVGIALTDSLRQKLARKEHHDGGENRVGCNPLTITKTAEQCGVEYLGKQDTIDDEGDVVAYEHRGNEVVGMAIEKADSPLTGTAAGVHLSQQAVARHEGYLHTRKECGEHHGDYQCYNGICHFVFLTSGVFVFLNGLTCCRLGTSTLVVSLAASLESAAGLSSFDLLSISLFMNEPLELLTV